MTGISDSLHKKNKISSLGDISKRKKRTKTRKSREGTTDSLTHTSMTDRSPEPKLPRRKSWHTISPPKVGDSVDSPIVAQVVDAGVFHD